MRKQMTDEGTARSAENIVSMPFLPLTRTLIRRLRRQLLLKGEAVNYPAILLKHGRQMNFFDTLTPLTVVRGVYIYSLFSALSFFRMAVYSFRDLMACPPIGMMAIMLNTVIRAMPMSPISHTKV